MPFFSKVVSRVSPSFLRFVRNHILLNIERIQAALPPQGSVLEIGCGYGHVLSELAESRPDISFLGLDVDKEAVVQARASWQMPNLRFESQAVYDLDGKFELILILDVIHHLARGMEFPLLRDCARLLGPNGLIFIKDIPHDNCRIGVFLDTYVSRCPPLVRSDEQFQEAVQECFKIISWETPTKLKMGELYVLAQKSQFPRPAGD